MFHVIPLTLLAISEQTKQQLARLNSLICCYCTRNCTATVSTVRMEVGLWWMITIWGTASLFTFVFSSSYVWLLVFLHPSEFLLFPDLMNELVEDNTTTEGNDTTLQKCNTQCGHHGDGKCCSEGLTTMPLSASHNTTLVFPPNRRRRILVNTCDETAVSHRTRIHTNEASRDQS